MAAKKILFLVGDFAEDYEVMVPFQALSMLGYVVHAVCPEKKAGDTIKTAIHDFEGHQTYTEKPGHNFTLNATFADADAKDYHALMLTGGRAPEYLRLDLRVIALVRAFAAEEQADCGHLPCGPDPGGRGCDPWSAGFGLCGLCARGAPRGGEYVETPPDGAIRDGNLVTGFAWPAHPQWLSLFLAALGARVDIG